MDHQKCKRVPEKTSTFASLAMLKPLTVDQNKLWKNLKEVGVPDHLTCLLRNLYADQEATVRTGHRTTKCSEVVQSYPTLCDSMDCGLPSSSVHGIFQARVLEWGAIAL